MSEPAPPGRLPRRPAQADEARAATAEAIDLRDLAERSDATGERPCPGCAAPAVRVDRSDAFACAACGRRWKVEAAAPWPDVIVDPTATGR